MNQKKPSPEIKTIRHNKAYNRKDAVPQKPGLYAWLYDYQNLMNCDEQQFIKAIESISKKLSYPEISGDLKGSLGTIYSAQLSNIDYVSLTEEKEQQLTEDIQIVKTCLNLMSYFSPPLYIGIAKNLRTRYVQHKESYEKATRDEKQKPCFGSRLYEMGIEPRELVFKYIVVEDTSKQQREAIEYVLNRMLKPLAGRR